MNTGFKMVLGAGLGLVTAGALAACSMSSSDPLLNAAERATGSDLSMQRIYDLAASSGRDAATGASMIDTASRATSSDAALASLVGAGLASPLDGAGFDTVVHAIHRATSSDAMAQSVFDDYAAGSRFSPDDFASVVNAADQATNEEDALPLLINVAEQATGHDAGAVVQAFHDADRSTRSDQAAITVAHRLLQ